MNEEMPIAELTKFIDAEFNAVALRFKVHSFSMSNRVGQDYEKAKMPGVYVYWHKDHGYIKVGKSQTNAAKRALQHCGPDNTSSKDGLIQMSALKNDADCKLIFITIENHKESMHWIVALEYFLETKLKPYIQSIRLG